MTTEVQASDRLIRRSQAGDVVLAYIDAQVARLRALDPAVRGNAFSFGLLNERAHRDALEYQRQARKVWKRAARCKARRWLSHQG